MNNDDELQPIEVDSYVDKLISSTALIKLGVDSVKVDKVLSDSELVKILTGVEVNNSSDSQEKLKGINSSKVIRTKEDEEKEKKEVQKKLQDLRTKLKEVLSNIVENVVEISEINNCESDDILQTMRMIREKGYDEEVVFEVGVNTLIVEKVLMSGAISVRLLNTIITSYNKQENSLHLQYES
jgi:response regulator RpfG family c-di-GMP phosphodiesterase